MSYKKTEKLYAAEPALLHKAVFLDRDGTLNSDEGHYYVYMKPQRTQTFGTQ